MKNNSCSTSCYNQYVYIATDYDDSQMINLNISIVVNKIKFKFNCLYYLYMFDQVCCWKTEASCIKGVEFKRWRSQI